MVRRACLAILPTPAIHKISSLRFRRCVILGVIQVCESAMKLFFPEPTSV
jgi:hypothetical protein